jgi:hypothetical protein
LPIFAQNSYRSCLVQFKKLKILYFYWKNTVLSFAGVKKLNIFMVEIHLSPLGQFFSHDSEA